MPIKPRQNEASEIWERNAVRWHRLGSPWRPSTGDLAIYREFCCDRLPGSVAILGSTPELRDLAAEGNSGHGEIVVIDRSRTMLELMGSISKVAKPGEEHWIASDWVGAPLAAHHFDLVIGDCIWQLLNFADQLRLRDKIFNVLKPRGKFVSRFRCKDPVRSRQDGTGIIRHYLMKLGSTPNQAEQIRDTMVAHLCDATVSNPREPIDRDRVRCLLAVVAEGTSNAAHRTFLLKAATDFYNANQTSQIAEEIKSFFADSFSFGGERQAEDYHSRNYPIMSFLKL